MDELDLDLPLWGGCTALAYAAFCGQIRLVKAFIRHGASVNGGRNGHTALLIAAGKGSVRIVKLLLSAGADVNIVIKTDDGDLHRGYSPLMAAADGGSGEVIQLLLSAGAELCAQTSRRATAVTSAVFGEHRQIALSLLKRGCPPGSASLLRAIANADLKLVVELLKSGASPNEASDVMEGWVGKGETPLGMAVRMRLLDVCRVLCKMGVDLNAISRERTPLDVASFKGYKNIAFILISNGADVNCANRFGTTPLMSAASEGHYAIVQLLIQAGADPAAKGVLGETAIDIAAAKRHHHIVELLENC